MAKRSNIRLDDDILMFQILPRLSVRSLGRCKCICKQWRSFLTSPEFIKMHLHHVNKQNQYKQLLVPSIMRCRYFQTIDCETPVLSANGTLPFEADSNRMSDNSDGNCFTVSARGYGLYYSSLDDDYKLLRITQSSDAYIYSLKSDSWRKVESTINCRLESWNLNCFLNEKLYLLAQGTSQTSDWSYLIIRFDTRTEKFTEMPAPSFKYFDGLSGCVHLCVNSKGVKSWDKWEVWKMDGDGEWTKVVCYRDDLSRSVFSRPLHLLKNGNWLVRSEVKGYVYVHEVDLEMRTEIKVRVYPATIDDMEILWGGKFVETIVSLKHI
ncbi:hypothetical protein OSB04_028476 [Centaurea solstitialis]|uniref:F-box domain-containing protein n=1 Tax=Centaurea solstitialis TaxID=347529 RepID=A0AA38W7R8_9ASTR|nr:hypothetical protein OSB04_028476 [Centaurea solstitialis]